MDSKLRGQLGLVLMGFGVILPGLILLILSATTDGDTARAFVGVGRIPLVIGTIMATIGLFRAGSALESEARQSRLSSKNEQKNP